MKNIGFDARLWNESGVGRYIRNLLLRYDSLIKQERLTVFLGSDIYDRIEFKNPNLKKIKTDTKWHTISEQIKFKKELEDQNCDLVHFPYFSYPVFYNRPFVITIHDLIIDHYPTGVSSSLPLPLYYLKHYAYRKVLKSAVKNSKFIISPSKATKDEIVKHYKASDEKVKVVYEGFDKLITNNKRIKLDSKNYILYVGNAYPHKNLDNLINAYEIIRKNDNIDLVCIGRDDFFYQRLKKKNINGLKILNNVDDSELFNYYTNARLLVMPSKMEGFGLPVLEAMNLSCPVVSSNTQALKEIGGDAAYYFDPEDTTDIAEKIKNLLDDEKLRKELVERGKKQAGKFSWEKCAEETIQIYKSCDSIRQG